MESDRTRRVRAAIGSAVFFLVAPFVVAGLIPWWLTGGQADPAQRVPAPLRFVGLVMVVASVAVLTRAFIQFVVEGIGTPAPMAPTERLVVRGLYRYVRNPMYLAVLTAIIGEALWLGQLGLLLYGFVVGVAVVSFVKLYEEPTLLARYGDEYEAYRGLVPGWWPRFSAPPTPTLPPRGKR